MAKDDDVLEGMDNEEDLLDFDLEDITPEDLGEGDSEEEVIELVDLVEEGKGGGPGAGDHELSDLLEEDSSQEVVEEINFSTDEISGIPDILEDDGAGEVQQNASAADISLSDLEVDQSGADEEAALFVDVSDEVQEAAVDEDLDIGERPDTDEERPEAEIPEIDLSGVFGEEPEEETVPDTGVAAESADNIEEMLGATIEAAVAVEAISQEEPPDAAVSEEETAPAEEPGEVVSPDARSQGPAISPEQIEAIVRDVVQEVVERVARETMAEVAEKVITEAIEALKQNLESSSE